MSEHEIYLARRSHESRVWHGRFRRANLKAEKKRRLVHLMLKTYLN